MAKSKKTTNDAVKILSTMPGKSGMTELIQAARINAAVAQLIFQHRSKAKLTQAALAERIGTTQSVIARLEDADYHGHSLSMLQRIAGALNKRLNISFETERRAA